MAHEGPFAGSRLAPSYSALASHAAPRDYAAKGGPLSRAALDPNDGDAGLLCQNAECWASEGCDATGSNYGQGPSFRSSAPCSANAHEEQRRTNAIAIFKLLVFGTIGLLFGNGLLAQACSAAGRYGQLLTPCLRSLWRPGKPRNRSAARLLRQAPVKSAPGFAGLEDPLNWVYVMSLRRSAPAVHGASMKSASCS
jgi:hypothetical protein